MSKEMQTMDSHALDVINKLAQLLNPGGPVMDEVETVRDENGKIVKYGIFEVGKTYTYNVPPGWLLAGTIGKIEGGYLVMKDSVYLESVTSGHSTIGSLPKAKPNEMTSIINRCYSLIDGSAIRIDAILLAFPHIHDVKSLARQEDAEKIKKAAGK